MSDPISDYVLEWLRDERDYTAGKYGLENDDKMTRERIFGFWADQIGDRIHRVQLLGLDTPMGRQAAAKVAATAMMALESVVRVAGELPEPGVTSGENLDDLRPLNVPSNG